MVQLTPFNSLLNEKLQNPEFAEEFRKAKNEVDFGLSLITAREFRNMTQSQLSELSGIRQETLSRIERGRLPDFKTILKIAKILNVRVVVWPDGRTLLEPAEQNQIAA